MPLLIVMTESFRQPLIAALNRFAPFDWQDRGIIHIFPLGEVTSPDVTERIIHYCQSHNIDDILAPPRIHCDEQALVDAGYTVIQGPSIKNLIHGQALRSQLQKLKLDWRSQVLSRLNNFGLAKLEESHLEAWLSQFEKLSNHLPVGEHLLQLVDVISYSELSDSLSIGADFYEKDLIVGFNKDKWGKSWGTVSNLMGKRCPDATLLPITEAIEKGAHPRVVRLVEDGLFSGTEMRGVFDSLRGTRPLGRNQKVERLSDPSILAKLPVTLQFGVVCDFGEAILRQYLSANELPNVQVAVPAAARRFRVLLGSPASEPVDSDQQDIGAYVARIQPRVVPYAFQDSKGWRNDEKLGRARGFCQTVGEQLWRNYINRKGWSGSSWPEERIKLCGLGMDGLGLTFAFPHSVPKATLPLFWARGPVSFGNDCVEWEPLFPSSDG